MTSEQTKTVLSGLDVAAKIVIAVIAGLWVLHTYPDTREKEFRKSYWDTQMSLLFSAAETASQIATLPPGDTERDKAIKKFWELYWGRMLIVESICEPNDPVDQAMIQFGRCLVPPGEEKPQDDCSRQELELRAFSLGKASRRSIGKSWDEKLESLSRGCKANSTAGSKE
jgi:hypothetical protein